MKKQLPLLACMLLCRILFSQAVPMALEAWRTTNGTQNFYYKAVTKTDPSGNVIVAGTTLDGATTDILVAKYNAAGNQLWIQQFQGAATGGVDFAAGLFADNSYIYITGGVTNNSVTPETDCVTMKLASSTGSVVWSASYDGAGNFHDAGRHIVVDGSGNVYVSGGSYNASMNTDFLCLKYNSSGVQQWASTWDYLGFDDAATKGATSGSNLNLTGAVTTATPNVYKVATLSLSQSTGSLLATSVGTAVTTTSVDVVTDFTSDGSGNIIVVGSNNVVGEGNNFYVQKLSNTLVSTWTYTWNGSASLNDVAKAVELDASGNVYIAGFSTSSTLGKELAIIKLNSSGTFQWVQTSGFSGDDEAADMIIDASSNIYVGGYKTNSTKDYYTAKYNASGTKIWETEMTGLMNDYATNITLDSLNNVIVTGQTEITAGTFNFTTVKYAQHEVITPTDFNGETPSTNFMYYTNRGQLVDTNQAAVPDIKFYTHNTYPSFYFKDRSQSFVFAKIDTVVATADTLHRIDMDFTNSIESSKTYAMNEQENGYLNYFLAHTDSNGITTRGNLRLVTPNLYTNIDLMCSSNLNGIKYYFIVKPGGDMRDIKLEFTGATSYSLDGTTNALSINSSIGSLTFDKPVAYQLTAGNATVAVTSFSPTWTTDGAANKYKFNDGVYTASLTLVIEVDQGNGASSTTAIDNLTWSTYYGGGSDDVFYDVKTNSSNNVWVTGRTNSLNFPVSAGAYQGTKTGNVDAMFVKFNNSGIRMWATYIGGSLEDTDYSQHGIEVDAAGNCYSAFSTSSTDFPLHASSISGAYYDGSNSAVYPHTPQDLAIVSFNNNGLLVWSTYFGGTGWISKSRDIGLDGNNNLFITGLDNGFPIVTPTGAYQNTFPISSGGAYFVAKFGPNHNLIWSSFFGSGVLIDKIAVTSINDIIIVGKVASGASFDAVDPGSGAYYDDTYNGGGFDGFIAKFSGENLTLDWSTLYGGSEDDMVHAIITDNNDNVYVSGETTTTTGLISGNSFGLSNTTYGGTGSYYSLPIGDGFLAKFNSLNQFVSSSYFGGAANEGSFDITYKSNRLFIPFITAGNDMPFYASNPSTVFEQSNNSDGQDVTNDGYFTVMDDSFNFIWSSYFGGTSSAFGILADDQILSNICSNDNKYYIVGGTKSSIGFPLVNPGNAYYQNVKGSSLDAFIAQFDISSSLVGVKELDNTQSNNLIVYPNPANKDVYVNFKLNNKYSLEIIDIMGKQIRQVNNIQDETYRLDLSDLSRGLYFVKVREKETVIVKKLILN